uniref:Putative secreted protein n=1 Tax=Ixodes ricinus TaxID=34613 RepID=A0A6B0UHD3_IXORI
MLSASLTSDFHGRPTSYLLAVLVMLASNSRLTALSEGSSTGGSVTPTLSRSQKSRRTDVGSRSCSVAVSTIAWEQLTMVDSEPVRPWTAQPNAVSTAVRHPLSR